MPGKRFHDFNEIRDEIEKETDREVKGSQGISSKPINLRIYSSDVLDLTLVDLPGMTRVPVGDQPTDIEIQIENMLLEYIENENCLILAVTAANQGIYIYNFILKSNTVFQISVFISIPDLATSDAVKLAKRVDPEGLRTIGVLTKLDLMDEGTNARNILMGEHLPLRMGYIGVINRSQKDINNKRDMSSALDNEQKFFTGHPKYRDISDRLGIKYLQQYLHKELSNHISKLLPPLKQKFNRDLSDIKEKMITFSEPLDNMNKERILSEANEQFRENFEKAVGGKVWKVDLHKLNGGAKINLLMNDSYPKLVDKMFYDENRMRHEIATAIQNFYGIYLGVFTPDAAFRASMEKQIGLSLV